MAEESRRSWQALRAPLAEALSAELGQLELQILRVWIGMASIGVLGGIVMAVVVSTPLGLASSATAGAFLVWFVVAERLLRRPKPPRLLNALIPIGEGLVPWAFAAVLARVQGPVYAMASWVPPMLVGALLISQTARFRVLSPFFVGVTGGLAHLVVYWVWVHPHLPADAPLYAMPAMQVSRALSLCAAGALAAMVGVATRRVVGRAEREVRAQDLFGKYRLLRHIASGGMGVVYEALYCPEGGFQRKVAVKRVHPHLAEAESFVSAFRAEAELSARLTHPNVVQVLDFGRVEDTYFLAMELVEGVPLSTIARRVFRAGEGLAEGVVSNLGHQLLAALAHAHGGARDDRGQPLRVVHRDLCPANVLVSTHGAAKITDFGLARALGEAAQTQTRSLEGHASYMAPEQAKCLPFDERIDLFAAGVILWELLVGRPLFRQSNEYQTLAVVQEAVVPPPTFSRNVDAGWDAFFARALAREPNERFASADEMARSLPVAPADLAEVAALVRSVEEELRNPAPVADEPATIRDASRSTARDRA